MACSLSKMWFVHSNSSLESSAGIGVLSMAKQAMLRMPGIHRTGEGHNQFWVLDKDVSQLSNIFFPAFYTKQMSFIRVQTKWKRLINYALLLWRTCRALLRKLGRIWILQWHVLPEVLVLMRSLISMRGLVLLKWYDNMISTIKFSAVAA